MGVRDAGLCYKNRVTAKHELAGSLQGLEEGYGVLFPWGVLCRV